MNPGVSHMCQQPSIKFVCIVCHRSYTTSAALKVHEMTHTGQLPHSCPQCEYRTVYARALRLHIRHRHSGEKPFECGLCDFATVDKSTLELHTRRHTGEKPYKCTHVGCLHSFSSRAGLRSHMSNRHLKIMSQLFRCSRCPFETTKSYSLDVHSRSHSPRKKWYKCKVCPFETGQYSRHRIHKKKYHPNLLQGIPQKLIECPWCPFKTSRHERLGGHMRTHTGERPYKCPFLGCPYAASYGGGLNCHLIGIHATQGKKYQCPKCPFKCRLKENLKRHMICHDDKRPFRCHLCRYRAKRKNSIKIHVTLTHSNLRPFACVHCPYAAKTRGGLNLHLRIHTQEKPFACPHCPYRSSQGSNLKCHVRTHTNENPYVCTLCDYSAKTSTTLVNHVSNKHTGEKHFTCQVQNCGFSSVQKTGLESHERGVHKKEKEFGCAECGKKFFSKSHLYDHSFVHKEEKTFACPLCDFRSRQPGGLSVHKKFKHGEGALFACKECDYVSKSTSNLKRHGKKHKPGVTLKTCPACGYRVITWQALVTHVKDVHMGSEGNILKWKCGRMKGGIFDQIKFLCGVCPRGFPQEIDLIGHNNEKHGLPFVLMERPK